MPTISSCETEECTYNKDKRCTYSEPITISDCFECEMYDDGYEDDDDA